MPAGGGRRVDFAGARPAIIGIACVAIFAITGILLWSNRKVDIKLNGEDFSVRVNSTCEQVISAAELSPKAGNLVSVSGKNLEDGAGYAFTASLGGNELSSEDAKAYRVTGGDELEITDGGDRMEDYDVEVMQENPQLEMGGDAWGNITYISQWPKPGSYEMRTGKRSGEAARGDTLEETQNAIITVHQIVPDDGKKLVALTGMDAMTHAIEAYVSTANCDFTDPLALHAIEMIQADLVGSYNGDMAKRDAMHNAQCLAGMAFSNALLGIVHSMAHKTGAAFADYGAHIIHGAANAMYLPKVIAFNAKDPTAKARYGVIADKMNLGGASDDEKVALLIKYLRGMNDDLNIPHCIGHYGPDSYPCEQGFVPENVFLERLPEIAKNAIADACTGSNPRQPSQEEMEKLLKCCYYDTEVDF